MINIRISFSRLYGMIVHEAMGELDLSKVEVGIAAWTTKPINPEWIGAKATKEHPFSMISADEPRRLSDRDFLDMTKAAHAARDEAKRESPEDCPDVSYGVTKGNLNGALYELCTYAGGASKQIETLVGEISVVVYHADGPEAAEAAQARVSEYLASEFCSRELWARTIG